jgi:hypothetical protein
MPHVLIVFAYTYKIVAKKVRFVEEQEKAHNLKVQTYYIVGGYAKSIHAGIFGDIGARHLESTVAKRLQISDSDLHFGPPDRSSFGWRHLFLMIMSCNDDICCR